MRAERKQENQRKKVCKEFFGLFFYHCPATRQPEGNYREKTSEKKKTNKMNDVIEI